MNRIVIYLCTVCQMEVKSDAIQCDMCSLWTHRTCAKMKKKELVKLSDSSYYYSCPKCVSIFPYSNIDHEEFSFLNTNIGVNENLFYLYNRCNDIVFNYHNDCENSNNDWDNKIDPEVNFYNDINFECNYVTDSQFKVQLNDNIDFSVIHFNARSLRANVDTVKEYLKNLGKDFHVIAISESWFDENTDITTYELDKYNMIYTNRRNKRGGGVVLYVRNDISFIKRVEFCSTIDNILESVTIEIVPETDKNILFSCVYRAPGSDLKTFADYIECFLKSIRNNKSVYLCGDMNIDILKYDQNDVTKDFVDLLYSYGLYPLVTKPTRVTSFSATLIDNFFTINIFKISKCGILCNDISDHLPIYFSAAQKGIGVQIKKRYKLIRVFNERNTNEFKSALENNSWNNVYTCDNANDAYEYFIQEFTDLYEQYFPLKKSAS